MKSGKNRKLWTVVGTALTLIGTIDVPEQLGRWRFLLPAEITANSVAVWAFIASGVLLVLYAWDVPERVSQKWGFTNGEGAQSNWFQWVIAISIGCALGAILADEPHYRVVKPVDVVDRLFVNEEVHFDGYAYRHCTFQNVTFVFAGTKSGIFTDNVIYGSFKFRMEENQHTQTVLNLLGMLKGFGMLKELSIVDSAGHIMPEPRFKTIQP
jgi:hypothetical protein